MTEPALMTDDRVWARLDAIRAVEGDDELAHAAEDALHQDVLRAIATGDYESSPARIARLALKTQEMTFARWCA